MIPGQTREFPMRKYLARRLLHFVFLIWAASTLTFFLFHLIPGDPAVHILGEGARIEDIKALRRELGLDIPVLKKYGNFQMAILTLDFGISIVSRKKVSTTILAYLPNTLFLSLTALLMATVLSFFMGYVAAVKQNSLIDSMVTLISSIGVALPDFLLAPLLILFFSIHLGWFPVSGSGGVKYLILPAMTLALSMTAFLTRIIKTSLAREMNRSYVVLARAKGVSDSKLFFKHILKNALSPIISTLGLQLGALLSGTIITETIFSWQGIGCLLFKSITRRDYPLVQGVVVFIVSVYLTLHLMVDFIYLLADPRQQKEIRKSE